MNFIRRLLGNIIIFFDAITRPRPIKRSEDDQKAVDEQTKHMALYELHGCPFCTKVRRTLHRLNLHVELREIKEKKWEEELIREGGKRKVPCLRIEKDHQVQWMYESSDIIAYLEQTFC